MEFFNLLFSRYTKLANWQTGFHWFAWIIAGGLLPIWGSLLFRSWAGMNTSLSALAGQGEFALYSASIMATSQYIVCREIKERPFPSRVIFRYLLFIALFISALFFSGATLQVLFHLDFLDTKFLVRYSTILLIFSIVTSLLITVMDSAQTSLENMQEAREQQFKELSKNFDKLDSHNG
jgi:hypothetical protein